MKDRVYIDDAWGVTEGKYEPGDIVFEKRWRRFAHIYRRPESWVVYPWLTLRWLSQTTGKIEPFPVDEDPIRLATEPEIVMLRLTGKI